MSIKSISFKNFKSLANRGFICLLILFPASLPYDRRISTTLLIILTIAWLLTDNYKKLLSAFKNSYVILFISIFVVAFASVLLSENKDFSLLEKRVSLLTFPIILFTSKLSSSTVRWIVYGFSLSCTIGALYTVVYTFNTSRAFDTEMTLHALGISHVYFGLFLSFSVVILTHFLIKTQNHSYRSLVMIAIVFFLLVFMLLLGGKMSIIALFFLALFTFIRFALMKHWNMGIFLILLPTLIFFFTITSFEKVKSRFSYIFNKEHYFVGDNAWTSIGVRLTIFKCSYEVFNNPIIGTGVGDVQRDLDKCYMESGYPSVLQMNAHNQYLQFLLGVGVLGLFLFLAILIVPLITAYYNRNYLFLCFIFLFSLCCLTESLLERQQGVMFYAYFNSFLLFHFKKIYNK